jgi:hypothetical protein
MDFRSEHATGSICPAGLNSMTEHILQAHRIDIETRTNPEGNQRVIGDGWRVNAHEIKPGVIYKDANVTVTAFATKHAMESWLLLRYAGPRHRHLRRYRSYRGNTDRRCGTLESYGVQGECARDHTWRRIQRCKRLAESSKSPAPSHRIEVPVAPAYLLGGTASISNARELLKLFTPSSAPLKCPNRTTTRS